MQSDVYKKGTMAMLHSLTIFHTCKQEYFNSGLLVLHTSPSAEQCTIHSDNTTVLPDYTPPVEDTDEDPMDCVWDKICTSLKGELHAQLKDYLINDSDSALERLMDQVGYTHDIIMASFNVLFFACDRSVCVRKDGEFQLLYNPGEVLCKWLVENSDESGQPITEERDFKATVLFQSSGVTSKSIEGKQLFMECGSRGSAGRLKRVLRELQEEEITEKRCKEKMKAKQSGQDMINVTNQTPAERTASQPGDASSQINLQKLQNLALLAGMATVLHPKSTSEYEAEREN
ncbi:hypothetical protein NDU88_004289 [Pleurodeles waltl]|uniref:Uncharacterized protein n=1 Tax=Pleurodeles waltl TaxID=8319 RepID=A0AAV7LJF0_PLEWA|nr:hypothetical protein NDU88_004289 [Pleurodeles waltl]